MDSIYHYVGLIVVWIIIIAAVFSIASIIFWFGWFLWKRYWLFVEKVTYYFGATISTEILRLAYSYKIKGGTRKLAIKYRLRNIKIANKKKALAN